MTNSNDEEYIVRSVECYTYEHFADYLANYFQRKKREGVGLGSLGGFMKDVINEEILPDFKDKISQNDPETTKKCCTCIHRYEYLLLGYCGKEYERQ